MSVDLLTVGLLVVLECLLSADNALVMAVIVLRLPRERQGRALTYGLAGAFGLRIAATLVATVLIRVAWIRLLGGVYLLYLVYQHFAEREADAAPGQDVHMDADRTFWATVVRLELVNLAFSVDSILVAVAMSPRRWVVLAGGLIGVLAIRLIVAQLLALMRRWPALADGAFVVIAWVGLRLLAAYAHEQGWIGWEVPQGWSLVVILALLLASTIYAIRFGPRGSTEAGDFEKS
jgi:YkoY family integral membrane protein